MAGPQGFIAIMGSGEMTDSMVRVHRDLLQRLSRPARAVFIDTPAGFQMNADDLFRRAEEYFRQRLGRDLERASLKSRNIPPHEAERAYQTLRQGDYIFVGPGSPTYALKNWRGTPIPGILLERIRNGAAFVAASAAALTLGRFTLPVYEIYKVGEEPHWAEGLDLLGSFGLPLAVIPHWNNAEGGTHDTRFCYMGEPRFFKLEALLPPEVPILGVDEHTALILDFSAGQASVQGIGQVTFRHRQGERYYRSGRTFPLDELRIRPAEERESPLPQEGRRLLFPPLTTFPPSEDPFFQQVQSLQENFPQLLNKGQGADLGDLLVNLDKRFWKWCTPLEQDERIAEAREIFRSLIVQLGLKLEDSPDRQGVLSPLVAILLEVREKLRAGRQWELADLIRARLGEAGITVEDTPQGARWRLK